MKYKCIQRIEINVQYPIWRDYCNYESMKVNVWGYKYVSVFYYVPENIGS